MDRPTLLIQGSSWTVGAYQKSSTKNSDELVSGGIAELLSERYRVTNISVKDDFNIGSSLRLREHLQTHSYDKILVCQNDPFKDLGLLSAPNIAWRNQFDFSLEQLRLGQIDTISKLINFLLDKYHKKIMKHQLIYVLHSVKN